MEKIISLLGGASIDGYRAIPFWSWNDKLEIEELQEQIKWMKKEGFGGFFMHARGGLITEYLGEEWFECIKSCVAEGEKQNMSVWAYDENGWPSGFVGGKLLENPENCDRYLTWNIGEYDSSALVSYLITEDKILRTEEGGKGNYLNVFEHISISTADILNRDVVAKFISMTHEKYLKKLGQKNFRNLKGFFTDEPQYYRAKHAYTRVLPEYFKKQYGEDLFDNLGLMFIEKDGYRTFRYKYWKAMQRLMLDSFAAQLYGWCDKNGALLTGHYVEETSLEYQMVCCGGVMPFYEYEHIPGMDHLGGNVSGPVPPKQVVSVATQLGKKQILTETFGCGGWGVTPRKLKVIAESQFVNGVNLMCQHLTPYSEHGQRKRDYPAHFSWANPWVKKDFKSFNDYFARLGYLIGESKENVKVALFCPVRSLYFDFKREGFYEREREHIRLAVDDSYIKLAGRLSAMNIAYHIIDETVMARHAVVKDGKLVVGNCAYDYIVFPKTLTMDKTSKALFDDFYSQNGKFLFTEGVPEYLEGEKQNYDFVSNTTFEEILSAQEYVISDTSTEIQSTLREIDGKKFIYAVNTSSEKKYTVTFDGKFNSFVRLDLETLETEKYPRTIIFNPGDSFVLFLSDDTVGIKPCAKEFCLDGEFEITDMSSNYMILDKLSYSIDGVNFSEPLRYMGVFNELLNMRYSGPVYLRYEFNIETVPESIYFLAEDMHNEYCEVNGNMIAFSGSSDFEKKIYKADIRKYVRKGLNRALIKINFFEKEDVYHVLFGENVTESLKNCLAYDTTIEACYLQGDFGVYEKSGYSQGKSKNVYLGNEFYIGGAKKVISDAVKDGYPFFAGNMTLRKTFVSDGKPCILRLDGDFCLLYLKINGKEVKKSYFADRVDVSRYVVAGENVAEITIYTGNRNLLGPFHLKTEENPLFVGPETYELSGTWKRGVSDMERADYSIIKFGLFSD